jgi:hypothetical protein
MKNYSLSSSTVDVQEPAFVRPHNGGRGDPAHAQLLHLYGALFEICSFRGKFSSQYAFYLDTDVSELTEFRWLNLYLPSTNLFLSIEPTFQSNVSFVQYWCIFNLEWFIYLTWIGFLKKYAFSSGKFFDIKSEDWWVVSSYYVDDALVEQCLVSCCARRWVIYFKSYDERPF